MNAQQEKIEETPEFENPYFQLQAKLGVTKHPGSMRATKELIEMCGIAKDTLVLDVGCGVGLTPCYISDEIRARVVGVDINEKMIARSMERAKSEGVESGVEFKKADAVSLPFDDNTFDVVICESVLMFVPDKHRAMSEFARVLKPGGCVGINEVTWLMHPTDELLKYMSRLVGNEAEPLSAEGWNDILKSANLERIVSKVYKIHPFDMTIDELKRIGFTGMCLTWFRLLALYFTSPTDRDIINELFKEAWIMPSRFFEFFGYGLYVGGK